MRKLKVAFTDFWKDFEPKHNYFATALSTRFEWELSEDPQLVICSLFGNSWSQYNCTRIVFAGENISSDPKLFDGSLTFDHDSETNYYLPLYRFYGVYQQVFKPRKITYEEWLEKKPIATVFSNDTQRFRNEVFHRLRERFNADSGGRAFNTVNGPVDDKVIFFQKYRFSMAFENTAWPGYTTEKILESYVAGTVPIYWGDPEIEQHLNSKAFLQIGGHNDLKALDRKLTELNENYEQYSKMYHEPLFPGNLEPEFLKPESVGAFLEKIVSQKRSPRVRATVSNFDVYHWLSRWRVKQFSYRLGWLQPVFLMAFTISVFFVEQVKRWIRR